MVVGARRVSLTWCSSVCGEDVKTTDIETRAKTAIAQKGNRWQSPRHDLHRWLAVEINAFYSRRWPRQRRDRTANKQYSTRTKATRCNEDKRKKSRNAKSAAEVGGEVFGADSAGFGAVAQWQSRGAVWAGVRNGLGVKSI